jgi:hypothetical protein
MSQVCFDVVLYNDALFMYLLQHLHNMGFVAYMPNCHSHSTNTQYATVYWKEAKAPDLRILMQLLPSVQTGKELLLLKVSLQSDSSVELQLKHVMPYEHADPVSTSANISGPDKIAIGFYRSIFFHSFIHSFINRLY